MPIMNSNLKDTEKEGTIKGLALVIFQKSLSYIRLLEYLSK